MVLKLAVWSNKGLWLSPPYQAVFLTLKLNPHSKKMANKTVLVVDDTPANINLLKQIIDSKHDVITATNGMDAINEAIAQLPNLILLDVGLPDINGFEVCKHLKKISETMTIPVIFISAYCQEQYIKKGREAGAVDYVIKPFDVVNMQKKISDFLENTIH